MATTTNWKMEFIFKITSASTADHQLYVGFGPVNSGTATLTTFVGCRYKTTTESDSAFHFVAGDGAWADSGTTSAVDNTAFHKFVMYSTVAQRKCVDSCPSGKLRTNHSFVQWRWDGGQERGH
jgi:hypothetical protein